MLATSYLRFFLATVVVVGSALVASVDATQSQQSIVDQLTTYRAQLDAANAQWQADSIAALKAGNPPPAFPNVPYPNITSPGYDSDSSTTTATTPTGTATWPSGSTPTGTAGPTGGNNGGDNNGGNNGGGGGSYDPTLDPNNPLSEDF